MSIWIILVIGVALLVSLTYVVLIISFTIGWFHLRSEESITSSEKVSVTVIIAARNEESNIGNCLRAIASQEYPAGLFEVIVVDDHSTDKTAIEINRIIEEFPHIRIKLIHLNEEEKGKKFAISKAVATAKNEWIVTTDADCMMKTNWLSSLLSVSADAGVQMVIAPVVFHKRQTVFGNLQELEFLSLVASSAGAVSAGLPIMCNGANLSYRRNAFVNAGGFISDKDFASGDDMFLMIKIRKMYGSGSIRFVKSKSATVATHAVPTLQEFVSQRLRWVSKSRGYKDPWVIFTSVIVFTQSTIILLAMLAWATGLTGPLLPLLLFTTKLFVDYPIMMAVSRFAERNRLMIWYLPLHFIYPLYVVAMGFLGNTLSFKWKGRKLR
jgi:cellulose synthase/poly-beta-1,6-N-acetylglucosamine synthase-like glycosyltransferase